MKKLLKVLHTGLLMQDWVFRLGFWSKKINSCIEFLTYFTERFIRYHETFYLGAYYILTWSNEYSFSFSMPRQEYWVILWLPSRYVFPQEMSHKNKVLYKKSTNSYIRVEKNQADTILLLKRLKTSSSLLVSW